VGHRHDGFGSIGTYFNGAVVSSQAFDRITSWKIAKQMEWFANGLQMILRMSFTDVWRKQFLPLSRRFRHERAGLS
jgi:hypothetical protein